MKINKYEILSKLKIIKINKLVSSLGTLNKISISKNRAAHLSKEIDSYLGEINKVNKQQEKINEKINKELVISEKIKEQRESINFKLKNYQ